MSLSRSSFIANLQTKMNDNHEMHTAVMESKKKLLHFEMTFRLFDEFPCLLFPDKLLPLTNRFKSIITTMGSFSETAHGFAPDHQQDAKNIIEFEKEIIQLACFELLDERGVRKEIIQFLKWDEIDISDEKIAAIICAYVSAINQEIFRNIESSTLSAHFFSIVGPLCTYINKNYGRKWVADVLRENGYHESANFLESEDEARLMTNSQLSVRESVVGIGLGLAGLGVLITAGIALFKMASSTKRQQDQIQPPVRSPTSMASL